ncbi:DUF2282 domain-containing protein [Leeia sp. TBRC 13508]|uniref:DUF2282 domain-containing protein n=1 Tax=Leeia speluncae TaxID=2884804 RepID=A0ABS8D505_9NEIS|nr:DUF2282 domain-containing protein [Leeia speluncae]MCB6183310.1 DUF2282 domain-containing protein [Leeia speluncae]
MQSKQKLMLSALTGLMVLGASASVMAEGETEKCLGVAMAGQNDCASINGSHSCAGQATVDHDAADWKNVPVGTCTQMGGEVSSS